MGKLMGIGGRSSWVAGEAFLAEGVAGRVTASLARACVRKCGRAGGRAGVRACVTALRLPLWHCSVASRILELRSKGITARPPSRIGH